MMQYLWNFCIPPLDFYAHFARPSYDGKCSPNDEDRPLAVTPHARKQSHVI